MCQKIDVKHTSTHMFSLAEILCGYAISAFESFLEGKQDPGPTASSAGWWIMTVL